MHQVKPPEADIIGIKHLHIPTPEESEQAAKLWYFSGIAAGVFVCVVGFLTAV